MKIPTTFLHRLLRNEAMQVSLVVERDCLEIDNRFEHEGMSFLTITLPSLDDALVQGLTLGRLTPSMFNGFKPFKRGGKLPAFMGGFFRRVFREDGSLLERPCIASIRAIRQVTRAFKKVELPCSDDRRNAAFERYRTNDESISGYDNDPCDIRRIAGYLWSDLQDLSDELYCSPGVFGTGATAERLAFNQRHSISQWPTRAEPWFPSSYHTSHSEDDRQSFDGLRYLGDAEEQPVRVVDVPKTLKAPRIISVEPSYMMLMQQSIAKPLMDYLESEHFQYSGSIRFRDQSHNREMARLGSIDGSYATIDLKDASDLVSLDLVRSIFSVAPTFLDYILACRSTRAELPDKTVINLRKYASQGSALCFPIEAMVFYTIVMGSIVRQSGRAPSRKLLKDITAKVSVYGDDIIVPAETAAGVMEDLQTYGLRVNHDKSFITEFFRESCGGDYYKGEDITPVYVRRWDFSGKARDPRVLESYISLSNQLYLRGLWNASQYIRDHIQTIHGTLARSRSPIGVATYSSVMFDTGLRVDPGRHAFRVKGPVLRVGSKSDPVRDIRAGMLVCFSGNELADRRKRVFTKYASCEASHFEFTSGFSGGISTLAQRANTDAKDDPCCEWLDFYRATNSKLRYLEFPVADLGSGHDGSRVPKPRAALDLTASVDPYSTKAKVRWAPTHVGMPFTFKGKTLK